MTDPRLLDIGFAQERQEALLRDAGVDTRNPPTRPIATAGPRSPTPDRRGWLHLLAGAAARLRVWYGLKLRRAPREPGRKCHADVERPGRDGPATVNG